MSKYIQKIKELRIEKGLSQERIAQVIGVSRPTYTAIEAGKQKLDLDEAKKLADFFGIDVDALLSGNIPNIDKYKQMVLAFLREGEKIPKTKLAKLLYFADFSWFYYHLESMSGMQYRKIQYGPVTDAYFRVIDEMFDGGEIVITQTDEGAMLISQTRSGAKVPLSKINKEEGKLIKDIEKKWKGKKTAEIVDFTHKQLPYLYAHDNEIVSYGLFTQEDPDEIF